MINLPPRVKAAFLRLKKANQQYIEIKHVKDYFFVYQSTSRWDKERKKPIKIPVYLGRITNNGQFIEAKKKKPRDAIKSQLPVLDQKVVEAGQATLETIPINTKRYKYEPKLLTALSMNGRISMSVLGKIVNLKETAVSSQVRKLEKRYGIKYIAEVDTTKLGYIQFLITVKFLEDMPKIEELKEVLSKEVRIQLALLTKGDSDIIMYALVKNSEEINLLFFELRNKLKYQSVWNAVPVFEDYGFIPLRNEFVEMLKDRLLIREYAVLKELIKDANIGFTEIDKKYKFDLGRSQYSYHKLKERGIIKRITVSLHSLPFKYLAIIFVDIVDLQKFAKNRHKLISNIIEYKNNFNKYILVGDIVSPDGSFFCLAVYKYGDLEEAVEDIANLDLGMRVKTLIVADILVGDLCYRNFDNAYSIQEDILVRDYGNKPIPKIDYEETGRIKKKTTYHRDIRGLLPEDL